MNIAKRWMSIRPAVKDGSPLKRRSVDRNIPVYKASKAWERDGLMLIHLLAMFITY